jgi:hypothetical protein
MKQKNFSIGRKARKAIVSSLAMMLENSSPSRYIGGIFYEPFIKVLKVVL